jgi:hypothetical integral membrane protein (TIGR02206 family)
MVNSFFDTTAPFVAYSTEHYLVIGLFLVFCIWFFRLMATKEEETQRKILLGIAIAVAGSQLAKIPLNLYTGIFDPTKDIPLHMCNFLPFVFVWIYLQKSRVAWAVIFFWVILGVSQSNFTPTIEYKLFYYDSIRYWFVHLFLVLLALYPPLKWDWSLEFRDIGRSIIALNAIAIVIYFANLALGSNYLYVMAKPEGTTLMSALPEWPMYILYLEAIFVLWSLLLFALFNLVKYRSFRPPVVVEAEQRVQRQD